MKKTLAILLSCMLIVGVVFAMAISASADEPATEIFASTIKVILPDGADEDTADDVIYVGKQPIFGEDGKTVTGFGDVANNPLKLGDGTLTLDAATGVVTIENISNVKKIEANFGGSVILDVKGTNTIEGSGNVIQVNHFTAANEETKTPAIRANLTIKGDGVLNVKSNAYAVCCNNGALTVTGNVTINGETTANNNSEVLHVAANNSNDSDLTIEGNAKLNLKNTGGGHVLRIASSGDIIFKDNAKVVIEGTFKGINTTGSGAVVIQDNADIKITVNATATWARGLAAHNLVMTSGNLEIDVVGADGACGLSADTSVGSSFEFLGGKVDVSVTSTGNRVYGLFAKGLKKGVIFDGAEVNFSVDNAASGLTDKNNSGAIGTQGTVPEFVFASGKVTFNGGENADGFIALASAGTKVSVLGGEISGTANSFLYTKGTAATLNIISGTIDVTSKVANISTESGEITQTATSGDYFVEAAGKSFKATTMAAVTELKTGTITKDIIPVSWNAVSGAVAYNVYRDGVLITETAVTGTSYDVPVMPATKYEITVKAVNALGGEGLAASVEATSLEGVSGWVKLDAPTGLKLLGANSSKVIVTWDVRDGADNYVVYVGGEKVAEPTENSYVITGLDKEVEVTVTAVNMVGESDPSTALKVAPAAASVTATLVEVVLEDGSKTYLGAGNTTADGLAFDAATGTVTLTDAKIAAVIADGDLTVVAKGTSTLTGGAEYQPGYTTNFKAENLVFKGDGTLNIASTASYPILGQVSVTFAESVVFNLNSTADSSGVHAARGGTGDCFVMFQDKAKVDIVAKGKGINVCGMRSSLIVKNSAKVTISAGGDGIQVWSDTVNGKNYTYDKAPNARVEVTNNASLKITKSNCGFRHQLTFKLDDATSTAGLSEATLAKLQKTNCTIDFIVAGNAELYVQGYGQTVYLRDNSTGNADAVNTANITVKGNAKFTVVNDGPTTSGSSYPPFQVNGDENNISFLGGVTEISTFAEKGAFTVTGKTTYTVAENVKSMIAGKSKDETKAINKFETGANAFYVKVEFENAPTSDFNVIPFAAMSVLALVGLAAVVVLRKKFN